MTKRGAQTLLRGLGLLETVAQGVHDLESLSTQTNLALSTAHRLLDALVYAGYLRHEPREGYYLGPKVIELGFKAHGQLHLPSLARPHLEWLSEATQESVHLAVLDGTDVVYIDKVSGSRGLQMASSIGGRFPTQCTALGKALISTRPKQEWLTHFVPGLRRTPHTIVDPDCFLEEIARTAQRGCGLDLEENEAGIRCIAAPIRDGSGQGVAAVSISTAHIHLEEERIEKLMPLVQEAARRISRELGWSDA
ncbi:MAG: Transcriptional regulator KdgR [Anaerolineales bacterium]|nr:Transcriptional regulator KdgR [Anaerolineales bacterium]